jgi:peptidyl-prolyl cis-trans isomerase D
VTSKIDDSFQGRRAQRCGQGAGRESVSTPAPQRRWQRLWQAAQKAPPELAKAVQAAFAMEREHAPQLAELERARSS